MSDDHKSQLYIGKLKMIVASIGASRLFAEIFQYLFDRYPKTQMDLARALHVDPSAINHWRKGRRVPGDSATIFRISKEFGLTSREGQSLLLAWTVDKNQKELIPYINAAIKEGDCEASFVEEIERILQRSYGILEEINESSEGD